MLNDCLPSIVVLATGGTIAGMQSDESSHAYSAGALVVEDLLAAVPGLSALANIRAEQVASVGSQNMSHAIWLLLAQRIETLCQDKNVDGIVITHGTDTLEETAYFLSLVIKHDKPIVLVGAMRPATAAGADGPANLRYAVALAQSTTAKGRGPLVVMNEEIHYAREVQKIACTGMSAFASPNRGRAGVMRGDQPHFYSRNESIYGTRTELSFNFAARDVTLPRVDVVYASVDTPSDLIDYLASKADGLVLAGVGDGNASDAVIEALQRAVEKGVSVVRASRTNHGRVARNVEVNDDAAGFIAAGDLCPSKARVLLTLALIKTTEQKEIQEIFDQY